MGKNKEHPYRIEFVTDKEGLVEPFIWERFPGTFPITLGAPELFPVDQYSDDQYTLYGCNLDFALEEWQLEIIKGFKEEGDLVDFRHGKRILSFPQEEPGED